MAGNDPEKTVLKFFTEKYNTFIQQFERRKTYAWTVANAKFALAIMLLLIFRPTLESWYSEHIAEQYLDITGWAINDWWVVALAVVIVVYGVIRACFGATISGKQAVWTFAALIIYAYYRLFGQLECTFQRINIIDMFAYTDLFALYGAVILGRFIFRLPIQICREYQEYKNPRIGFHYDEPLKHDRATGRIDAETDKLGRAGYAAQIAQTIRQTRSKDAAFAMGITGSWGSGKTSFWRLIEGHLCCDSNIIIIEYRPWQNHGSGVIVKDFFAVLSQQLRPYDSSLSGAVDTYTKILLDADDSTLTQIVKPIRALFCDESTVATEFARINDTLRRIDKQIVIFIDDLDRLDKTEVLDVIRLIRNTANFANIFFVAAYDRGYIMQALEDFNSYNKEAFLEKIFQLEVPLPKFEQHHLTTIFEKSIENVLTEEDAQILKKLNLWHFEQIFHSIRDINRFANLFIESYKPLQKNIRFEDLLHVELLKYKYPGVYDIVFDGKMRFLSSYYSEPGAEDYVGYHLTTESDENRISFITYLNTYYIDCGITQKDVDVAIDLLRTIFSEKENNQFSVINPSSFLRYSFARLADSDVSVIEFSNERTKGYDSLKSLIDKWQDSNCDIIQIENLLFNKGYDDVNDFIVIFKVRMLYIRGQFYKDENKDIKSYAAKFHTEVSPSSNDIIKNLFSGDIDAFITVFIDSIRALSNPDLSEIEFIYLLLHQKVEKDDVFTKKRISELLDELVYNHVSEHGTVDLDILNLVYKIYADFISKNVDIPQLHLSKDTKTMKYLIENLIPQNIDDFICISIVENDKSVIHHPFIENFFENFTGYKTYLELHDYTKTEIGKRYASVLNAFIANKNIKLNKIDKKRICEG